MRRFINSFLGRVVSNFVVLALVLPTISFVTAKTAVAQVQTSQVWAVVEFVNKAQGGSEIGSAASDAVANELAKLNQYEVTPGETVKRAIDTLGLQTPVTDKTSLMRLAGELRASTLVTGEVVNWRVRPEGGGKKADVLLRVVVIDTASGLPVNGAALGASSSVRAGNVDDKTLVSEALTQAAAQAIADIRSRTLPQATVLNTFNDTALINRGTRSGFEKGQEVIVTRGREQVATAIVEEVEPDSSSVKITRPLKGIQPGDKVRVVVAVPTLSPNFGPDGSAITPKQRKSSGGGSGGAGFTSIVLVLGIVGLLLSGGRASSKTAADQVNAEAGIFPEGSDNYGVKVSWRSDLFARGSSQKVEWQIFRNDVPGTPVQVVSGLSSSGIDDLIGRTFNYGEFNGIIGGSACTNTSNPTTAATVTGVTVGRPYNYSVALVYRLSRLDLPGASSTGGGGTAGTAGTTTGGGTAGTTTTTGGGTAGTTTGGTAGTAGGTTTGGDFCYFISDRKAASGIATPLARVQLVTPGSNANLAADSAFTFNSVVTTFPITVEYVLQISTDPNFPKNKTKVYATLQRSDLGTLSTGLVTGLITNLRSDFGSSQQEFWWRMGARNVADSPGPVKDANGNRYVFSAVRRFTIPLPPPPPPVEN